MSQLILQPFRRFTYVTAHSPTFPSLHLCHNSFSNPSVALPTSQLILQPFHHCTYVTTHSPTLPSLYLRHSSFSNLSVTSLCSFSNFSVTSSTSQLILKPFRRYTYVTAHSPTLPLLHLRHSSFSNLSFASSTSQALHLIHLVSRPCWYQNNEQSSFSNLFVTSPTLQLILQPFHCFTYVTTHSPILPLLHLRHSSFSNPSVVSPTSQFILQPFFRFSCVTSSSLNSPGEKPMRIIWSELKKF